jgi:hypothetical protein
MTQRVASKAGAANISAVRGSVLQRQCACGQHATGGECGGCAKKKQVVRRAGHDAAPASAPPVVHDVLGTPGRPLDPGLRAFMEPRFGRDFSDVRVHAGSRAAASAAAVGARAYTVGRDIVLDGASRSPADERRLFAHELTHVVQQRGAAPAVLSRKDALEIGAATDPAEREADAVADSVLRGAPVAAPSAHAAMLQRDPAPGAAPQPAAQTGAPHAQAAAVPPGPAFVGGIDLGNMGNGHRGYADALLYRPARDRAGEQPQCGLTLYLKIHFDFHAGPPKGTRVDGPEGGAAAEGGPWPIAQSNAWKAQYMQIAQSMWHTEAPLAPAKDCPAEPCKSAVGRLRVIDADTMKDSDGQAVSAPGMTNQAHYNVNVFENRPIGKRSAVATGTGTLFKEDVQPLNTPEPQGHDKRYGWHAGAAAHETGHMLGRPHVGCEPDKDTGGDECYGRTVDAQANVMGKGADKSKEDQAPFLTGMKAATGCEWQVSGGLGAGWIALIVGGSVLGTVGIVGSIAYAASKSKK